jgi:biotin operon repressor
MIEAKMTADARSAVLKTGDFLSAVQLAEMAGFSKTNPSEHPNKWKQDGLIFAVNQSGVDLFPKYSLDPAKEYRPYKVVGETIKVFGSKKDGWGLAFWFASVNSFLCGARPQDLIVEAPEKVIAAAKDALADVGGVSHG